MSSATVNRISVRFYEKDCIIAEIDMYLCLMSMVLIDICILESISIEEINIVISSIEETIEI